ncbi:MAG TPA: hypothetical protein VNY80_07335 [Steroidobacteraceae bacterium]|jgi:hypothetical protein|nr:hypothetical protein [Steroidobacteraceae bacterium]
MGRIEKHRVLLASAAGLAGLFMLNSALAAPPPRQMQNVARRLDLSAPAHSIDVSNKVPAFSTMSHQQTSVAPEQGRFANLGSGPMHLQPSMQDRVRLFRRDGFPVARLWENKSALVHLGFNAKGKPGLWIVQKTH